MVFTGETVCSNFVIKKKHKLPTCARDQVGIVVSVVIFVLPVLFYFDNCDDNNDDVDRLE